MTEPTPLEMFVLSYLDAVDGAWQAVEPQVYDALLAPEVERQLDLRATGDTVRFAFDPEAMSDYPGAHLMVFGNPTLDRLFQHAQSLGQVGRVYLSGFNLTPHDLPVILKRSLKVPEGVAIQVASSRVYHFPSALFWFQSTFVSDEKEQETLAIGIDLHYGRPARHLAQLLQGALVSDARPVAYPDASAISLGQAYALARDEAARAITVAAHARLAELQRLLERETQRITRYFADLRDELDDRRERASARDPQADIKLFDAQREALDREEQAQVAGLRRKMSLSVQVRLLNVLIVLQPKLSVGVRLAPQKGLAGEATAVYDPAGQRVEALPCASCGRPTLALALTSAGQVVCPDCVQAARAQPRRHG